MLESVVTGFKDDSIVIKGILMEIIGNLCHKWIVKHVKGVDKDK